MTNGATTGFSNLKSIQGIPGFNAPDADSGIRTPARELPAYWFSRPAPSSAWVSLQIILHLHLDLNFIVTILYDSIENLSRGILNKFKSIQPLVSCIHLTIGVTGFEPAASASQAQRSSQTEPHPVSCL